MNLMEWKLQKILQENHMDFINSLRLSGIDVEHGNWSADAVEKNAQVGALSLVQFASQDGISDQSRNEFLQTITENLNEKECVSVMGWICLGFQWTGRFPPYAIIQHMIDPMLFSEYCVFLKKYLYMHLHGYFPHTANIV